MSRSIVPCSSDKERIGGVDAAFFTEAVGSSTAFGVILGQGGLRAEGGDGFVGAAILACGIASRALLSAEARVFDSEVEGRSGPVRTEFVEIRAYRIRLATVWTQRPALYLRLAKR